MQTALGLVAAEDGICIVPASVHTMGRRDIVLRELVQKATSPIIISHRKNDDSPLLISLFGVIASLYRCWGWPMPAGITSRMPDDGQNL